MHKGTIGLAAAQQVEGPHLYVLCRGEITQQALSCSRGWLEDAEAIICLFLGTLVSKAPEEGEDEALKQLAEWVS